MAERCSVEIAIYRAALFDMDGVITDTMPLHYESWRRAFEPYGVKVERMEVYLREGMTSDRMVREIVGAKGLELSEEDAGKIVAEKTRVFNELAMRHARAYDGVYETLRMLRNNGVKLALVTGSKRESVNTILGKVRLEGSFDAIVSAEDITKGKPDPEPYLAAMRKLEMPALDCVVIENAPLGIQSARAAKAGFIIAITSTLGDQYLQDADDIQPSFSEMEQCLARRFEATPGRAIM